MPLSDEYLYFLRIDGGPWRVVDQASWVNAEHSSGVRSGIGHPDEAANLYFKYEQGHESLEGRCIHPSTFVAEVYDTEPAFRDTAAAEVRLFRTLGSS